MRHEMLTYYIVVAVKCCAAYLLGSDLGDCTNNTKMLLITKVMFEN